MTFRIDDQPLDRLSLGQIGALLQAIASELSVRGNAADCAKPELLLWAFNEVQEAGDLLRRAR